MEDNAVDDNGIELDEIQEKRDEENVSPTSVSNIDQYRYLESYWSKALFKIGHDSAWLEYQTGPG